MNWKYFAMVGVEKGFDSLDNQVVYRIFVSNDFEKSSEVVGVGDGYDVINEVSFVPRSVGKIKGKEFIFCGWEDPFRKGGDESPQVNTLKLNNYRYKL